jgi:hypothetical protein
MTPPGKMVAECDEIMDQGGNRDGRLPNGIMLVLGRPAQSGPASRAPRPELLSNAAERGDVMTIRGLSVPGGPSRRSWAHSPRALELVRRLLPCETVFVRSVASAFNCSWLPCSPKSSLRWVRQDPPLCYPLPVTCNRRHIKLVVVVRYIEVVFTRRYTWRIPHQCQV